MKASPVPASLGKHCRHASTSPFTLPDHDFFSRPLERGVPEAAPENAASTMWSQADQLSASCNAASTTADATSPTCPHMTGQESLQKATVALKGLQTKYGQASSLGSGQEMPSGIGCTADTEADRPLLESSAAPGPSRSSFSFQSAVGLRGAARLPGGAHPSGSGGAHPSISREAHPSSPGEGHAGRLGRSHPSSSGDVQPRSSKGAQSSSSAYESSHAGDSAADYLMLCLQTDTPAFTMSLTAMACCSKLQSCCCHVWVTASLQ